MAHQTLTYYGRQLLTQPDELRRRLTAPVLVWETPPDLEDEEYLLGTLTGPATPRPSSRDPLVFEVRKGTNKQNAFGLGITIGRTENNDITLDDNSVSRFHAYFQQDKSGGWTLVDAESRNGTWVDGAQLTGRAAVQVKPGAKVRIGGLDLRFFEPEGFIAFMNQKIQSS